MKLDHSKPLQGMRQGTVDAWISAIALLLMVAIPFIEIGLRPFQGSGVENASVLVQHLGLVLAMFGAVAAERGGHLTTLGGGLDSIEATRLQIWIQALTRGGASMLSGMLGWSAWEFVSSEIPAAKVLAYGVPVWWVQMAMPIGFMWLSVRLGARCSTSDFNRLICSLALPAAGAWTAWAMNGKTMPLWPAAFILIPMLWAGTPVFALLGGLALALFANESLPLASVALSHYQITVNPSLPALPLFTLAGLILARTAAAQRLGVLFQALFGVGVRGSVIAAAAMCSAFTAFTGGSGVTILALGGLLLPLLREAGYGERKSIGLVTSASALGVLLAPSVPLIMVAIIARVPIKDMLLAGLLPAMVMVVCLLLIGGFLSGNDRAIEPETTKLPRQKLPSLWAAVWDAKWELAAPVVAVGSLLGGLATPTESAALTAAYVLLSQGLILREISWQSFRDCLIDCAQTIGAVLLILGMALALTNYLVDSGLPDQAVDWVQNALPNRYLFLLALCGFLFVAAALVEIYAAIVVLVPLLLPLARSYGIDPIHFGIIFLAAMEVGFLCPPAGINIYFASAMFGKSVRYVGLSVLPAMVAILAGTLIIAAMPIIATGLPYLLRRVL